MRPRFLARVSLILPVSCLLVSAAAFTPGVSPAYQDQRRTSPEPAQALPDRCDADFELGEYQQAVECYGQALRLKRAAGDRAGEAATLTALGLLYIALGELQRALEYYNEALPIARAAGDRLTEAAALTRIGWIHAVSGRSPQAFEYTNQDLSLYQAAGDRAGEAFALMQIGEVHSRIGDRQRAIDYFKQALALRRALGSRVLEVITLNRIGTEHQSWAQPQQALEHLAQAERMWGPVRNPRFEIPALVSMARAERDLGHLGEARRRMESALDIVESVSARGTSNDLRASYRASMQRYYQFYINLMMQMHQRDPSEGHDAAALQASERARARSLLGILTEARADIRQGVDRVLLERERSLQQQLNTKEQYRMQLLSGKHTDEQIEAAEKELKDLLEEYQQVQTEIRAKSPRYAALMQPRPLNLAEIQQQVLGENTLLLEYVLGEERSYLWAVMPASLTSFELPKRAEIESVARGLYDALIARNKRVRFETAKERKVRIAQADAEYENAASALSRMLLGPVAEQLGTKRLLIVSDGILQYIPFAALPVPVNDERGTMKDEFSSADRSSFSIHRSSFRPLILDHEIISLPSASVLAVLRRDLAERPPAPQTVAVLADPVFQGDDPRVRNNRFLARGSPRASTTRLPGASLIEDALTRAAQESGLGGFDRLRYTRREAEGIMAVAPTRKGLKALDFSANRAMATSPELGRYRIVHFATHALLNSQHPELSGIVLSLVDEQGQPQNGFLRLHEIYNLKLPADVVVLSACQTALGKEIRGEGLVGLTRGFMYAGAARVVATLWDVVDESTAELMSQFYRGMLREGLPPAAALRAAQVGMWQQKRWKAPYYWAAFVLQGEWK